MKKGIAVAGSILVDAINTINVYPAEGELAQIAHVSRATGGCVPNVAVDLKKMDGSLPVYAIGCVGADDNGTWARSELSSCGIDVSQIKTLNENTSFTQVMSVSGGQRTFFTYPGASAFFGAADVDFSAFEAKLLHLGYFLLLDRIDAGDGLEILKRAKEEGIRTSIDLISENSDKYRRVLPCLPYTDFLIVNELEGGRLSGIEPDGENIPAIAECLLKAGVRGKVIIHFPDGAVCASANGETTVMGSYILPEGYIRGTTGAGDAFCAGALYALYHEMADSKVLEYGMACAAMALSAPDAVSGITEIRTALSRCAQFRKRTLFGKEPNNRKE